MKEVAAQLSKLRSVTLLTKKGEGIYYGIRDEWNAGVNSQVS